MIIPRYIPRDYIGEPVTGVTPLYNTSSTVTLSFYPGININNTILTVLDTINNEIKVEVIELVDLVLIMSVNPGFGGQTFIPNSVQKTKDVKALAYKCGNINLKIEIDGGVSITNAKDLIAAGANVLVVGNFVFNSKNPKLTISDLLKLGE